MNVSHTLFYHGNQFTSVGAGGWATFERWVSDTTWQFWHNWSLKSFVEDLYRGAVFKETNDNLFCSIKITIILNPILDLLSFFKKSNYSFNPWTLNSPLKYFLNLKKQKSQNIKWAKCKMNFDFRLTEKSQSRLQTRRINQTNLQDVSVSLQSVHECSIERSCSWSIGVFWHLIIHSCQLANKKPKEKLSKQSIYTLDHICHIKQPTATTWDFHDQNYH